MHPKTRGHQSLKLKRNFVKKNITQVITSVHCNEKIFLKPRVYSPKITGFFACLIRSTAALMDLGPPAAFSGTLGAGIW